MTDIEFLTYQEPCVDFLSTHRKVILDAYMGTGKSLMTLTAVLHNKPSKVLILCSKNALWTWQKELKKWYPEYADSYVVVNGTSQQRQNKWKTNSMFYVCTYATTRSDIEIVLNRKWDAIICDEFHRSGIRNRKSLAFTMMKQLVAKCTYMYLLSGTTTSRGPQDLWAPLNIIDPKSFPSYWKFVNTFCEVIQGAFGKVIGGAKKTDLLAEVTKHCYYKIPTEITDKALPPLTRRLIPVEMNPDQARLYKAICNEMYVELSQGQDEEAPLLATSTILSKLTLLRQTLVCPKIIDPILNSYGAGIDAVLDCMEDVEDYHAVIFTPFKTAVLHFEHYLRDRKHPVFKLWGGMEPNEVRSAIDKWKASRGIMLCTIQFAQSFELETARRCYFIGYDYDPNNNQQAESRLRRAITKHPVTSNYIQHKDTVDDRILEILNTKTTNIKLTFQNIKQLREIIYGEEEN